MEQERGFEIIERLLQALKAHGAHAAAKRLAWAQPLVAEGDATALHSLALRHCREYALDADWVLLGRGRPEDAAPLPELTPVFAMSSVNPDTGRWQRREIERIALSPDLLAPGRFVSRMEERCLEPRIVQGAYLVIDTKDAHVPRDRESPSAFAVDLRGEGLVVRLARHDRSNSRLEWYGLAADCPSFFTPPKDQEKRLVGRVVWVAQPL